MKKLLVVLLLCFMLMPLTINGATFTIVDVNSDVYKGKALPYPNIASFSSYGFRLYVVEKATGNIYGDIVDFAPADKKAAYQSSLKIGVTKMKDKRISYSKTDLIGTSSAKYPRWEWAAGDTLASGIVIPSPASSDSGSSTKFSDFNNKLFENNGAAFKTFYFKYMKKSCDANCQTNEFEKLTKLGSDGKATYYLVYEPLSLYTILSDKYSLTAQEAAGFIIGNGPSNFGTWFAGNTYVATSTFEGQPVKMTVNKMIDTTECRGLADNILDLKVKMVESGSAGLSSTIATKEKAFNDLCRLPITWRLKTQVLSGNPRYIRHELAHVFGTGSSSVTFGKYFNKTADYGRYSVEEIANRANGVGIGFAAIAIDLPKCPFNHEIVQYFDKNNPNININCCDDYIKYKDGGKIVYDSTHDAAYFENEYNKYCGVCSMVDPKTWNDLPTMAGKSCCESVGIWINDLNNKNTNPVKYAEVLEKYNRHCKCSPNYTTDSFTEMPTNKCCDPANNYMLDWLQANSTHPLYNQVRTAYDAKCDGGNVCVGPGCSTGGQTCTYDVDVNYPNMCSNNTTGRISDNATWDCIFDSYSLPNSSNFKEHYREFNNSYCSVFCRTDIDYNFPNSSFTVNAGQHFTVGQTPYGVAPSWDPVNMVNTATCKTSGIDVPKFESDWASANSTVRNTWNDYQIMVAKKKSSDDAVRRTTTGSITTASGSATCNCDNNTSNVSCCTQQYTYYTCSSGTLTSDNRCDNRSTYALEESDTKPRPSSPVSATGTCTSGTKIGSSCYGSCSGGYRASGTSCYKPAESCPGTTSNSGGTRYCTVGSIVAATPNYACVSGRENYTRTYYDPTTVGYNGTNYTEADYCPGGALSYNTAPLYTAYNNAVARRDGYLSELRQCTDFRYDSSDFSPDLSVKYEAGRYGGTYQLVPSYDDQIDMEKLPDANGNIATWSCGSNLTPCRPVTTSYPMSLDIFQVAKRTVNYTLPANLYNYVDKFSAISSDVVPSTNYLAVGYSNLPVEFTTPTSSNHPIELMYGSLGATNKFNKFILLGADGVTITNGLYQCTYNIYNDILCTPGDTDCPTNLTGLNVIFRPVSLTEPFPGKEGETRTPGKNWSGFENTIVKNRGVDADEVYGLEPMYEITLSPLTLLQIRNYNKEQLKSGKNYMSFDGITCEAGTGEKCISSYLTSLKTNGQLKINECARTGNSWNNQCRK